MTGTHILSKQNFLLLRPSWMPSWISQSAINYTNLCWHFQILQAMPNILVYDTSCKKKRFDSLKFWLHRVRLKMTVWEQKMTKILHILGISIEISVFPKKSSTFIRKPAKIWLYHSWYWVGLIYLEKNKIFFWATIFGRHLGFLSSPSVMPIYAGSFRNYRLCRAFWYMTRLVLRGGRLPLEIVAFLAHSHPTIYNYDSMASCCTRPPLPLLHSKNKLAS